MANARKTTPAKKEAAKKVTAKKTAKAIAPVVPPAVVAPAKEKVQAEKKAELVIPAGMSSARITEFVRENFEAHREKFTAIAKAKNPGFNYLTDPQIMQCVCNAIDAGEKF